MSKKGKELLDWWYRCEQRERMRELEIFNIGTYDCMCTV